LLDDRSAQLNVALPLEIDGLPRSMTIVRANEVLTQLDLVHEASLPIDCLSGAERQRVAVARALVRKPELVIADHPTSMQDGEGAELVCSALAEACAQGAAVIVLGRDPVLRSIADRRGWRQFALADGRLRSFTEFDTAGIDEMLASVDSEPTPVLPTEEAADSQSNVVPFPLSARTAGVA
jgi:ABC-type ATPase involved in cell division